MGIPRDLRELVGVQPSAPAPRCSCTRAVMAAGSHHCVDKMVPAPRRAAPLIQRQTALLTPISDRRPGPGRASHLVLLRSAFRRSALCADECSAGPQLSVLATVACARSSSPWGHPRPAIESALWGTYSGADRRVRAPPWRGVEAALMCNASLEHDQAYQCAGRRD